MSRTSRSSRPNQLNDDRAWRLEAKLVQQIEDAMAASLRYREQVDELFGLAIHNGALTDRILALGSQLQWPKDTASVALRRMIAEITLEEGQASRLLRLRMLPLHRLTLEELRAIFELIVRYSFPFVLVEGESNLPAFVSDLRQALLSAGERAADLDVLLEPLRQQFQQDLDRLRDAEDVARNPERRMREMERCEHLTVPASLRSAWLTRQAEARARGVLFVDPLAGCYRCGLIEGPSPSVTTGPLDRVLLVAEAVDAPCDDIPTDNGFFQPQFMWFALDLGRPTRCGEQADYPVLLVGNDDGIGVFVREVAATSAQWVSSLLAVQA